MPAAKKFTARQVPALLALAAARGLDAHKVDSKTYQFAPVALRGDHWEQLSVSADDMGAMERFETEVASKFAAYALNVDARGRFVSVTWAKTQARTQSQLDNVD